MINIRSIVQIIKQIYSLIIRKFMEELEIDWIRKASSGNGYIGRGHSGERLEMDSYDFYNCL